MMKKTPNSGLHSDWDTIADRLAHYCPVLRATVGYEEKCPHCGYVPPTGESTPGGGGTGTAILKDWPK